VDYVYNPSTQTGVLTASWWEFYGMTYSTVTLQTTDSDPGTTNYGKFELQAELDSTGQLVPGGSNSLLLSWETLSGDETLFYSTTLTDFGFGAEDQFEFYFTQEGDTAVVTDGETLGVMLFGVNIPQFNDPNDPVFNADFHNSSNSGYSDTFYLPEPATMTLLVLGGLAAFSRRSRKR